MPSDIAQAGRPQQAITNGVGKDVAVGMPDGAFVKGDMDPAKNQLTPGSQTVEVIPDADAN